MIPAARSLPLASAWMFATLLSFLMMAIAGRELSVEIGPAQTITFRNLACLAVLIPMLFALGWRHATTRKPVRHIVRNSIHFAAQFGWFFAIAYIPIAEVFAIEFTTPIWTAILAALFLGERVNTARVIAIALAFVGVLVILRPGLAIVQPAALAALASALGYACTYVITKDIVGTDRPLTILLWMNAVQLPIGLALSAPDWVTPSASLWPWIGAIGVAGLASHYCLSRALAHGDATIVVPIDFLRLPLAAGVAWLLYGERVDPFVFIGAIIIFAGIWINLKRG